MNYAERLKDPRWQKKRLEILERDNWSCRICGCETITLHVHHRVYIKGRMPWEYENDLLVTYCKDCHEHEEDNKKEATNAIYEAFAKIGFSNQDIMFLSGHIENLPFVNWTPPVYSIIKHVMNDKDLMTRIYKMVEMSYAESIELTIPQDTNW